MRRRSLGAFESCLHREAHALWTNFDKSPSFGYDINVHFFVSLFRVFLLLLLTGLSFFVVHRALLLTENTSRRALKAPDSQFFLTFYVFIPSLALGRLPRILL